jgi:hypothetical protein
MRIIEERCEYGDGICDEWQASSVNVGTSDEKEVTAAVRRLNKDAKASGLNIRYRSRLDESGSNW